MSLEPKKVQIKNTQGSTDGVCKLLTWTPDLARKKSLNILYLIWGGGAVSLFIPLVHFLTVPICLIFGPIIARQVYNLFLGEQEIVEGQGTCPSCKNEITFTFSEIKNALKAECLLCKEGYEIIVL